MENKKGQQMTLGTIIAIVLGIAVLVFLIFGFSTGWGNMWDKIINIGGGSANVDSVVRGCEVACTSQSAYSYCGEERTVNFGDGTWEKGSCKDLVGKKAGVKSCALSCSDITSPGYTKSEDSGAGETEDKKCGDLDLKGVWVKDIAACPGSSMKDRTTEVDDDSDKGPNTICCSTVA